MWVARETRQLLSRQAPGRRQGRARSAVPSGFLLPQAARVGGHWAQVLAHLAGHLEGDAGQRGGKLRRRGGRRGRWGRGQHKGDARQPGGGGTSGLHCAHVGGPSQVRGAGLLGKLRRRGGALLAGVGDRIPREGPHSRESGKNRAGLEGRVGPDGRRYNHSQDRQGGGDHSQEKGGVEVQGVTLAMTPQC